MKRKEKQILFSELLHFYCFKVVMKQSDETSFVTISLGAVGEHFMMINTSLNKDSSPTTPTYFLK